MIEELERVSGRDVSRETFDRMKRYSQLLIEENQRQNLISRSGEEDLWRRHILDSAQLLRFAPRSTEPWVDIGSGPGLPGLVIAILTASPICLVEPRSLRVEFLERVVGELGLANVEIVHGKASAVDSRFGLITARAVAGLDELFRMTLPLSQDGTKWILPKGRGAQKEVDQARQQWQGDIRVEPSLTSEDSLIVIASGIRPRLRGGKK